MSLHEKKCVPCAGGTLPLQGKGIKELLNQLGGEWQVVEDRKLEKNYKFKNFRDALAFVNRVGAIAEEQGHHPDLLLSWGLVKVVLWTHKINGLTESDFILAAKCDKLISE